jgi:hypothetical protein
VCARSAYAAFVLQAPVLLTLAIMARWISIPALPKGILVGALAVAISFTLGWLFIAHVSAARPWRPHSPTAPRTPREAV